MAEIAAQQLVEGARDCAQLAETARIIGALLANLKGEDCAKFRRVNCANAKIKAAVVEAIGGENMLIAVGFERAADGALEMNHADASERCAAGLAALDAACIAHGAPFLLRSRL